MASLRTKNEHRNFSHFTFKECDSEQEVRHKGPGILQSDHLSKRQRLGWYRPSVFFLWQSYCSCHDLSKWNEIKTKEVRLSLHRLNTALCKYHIALKIVLAAVVRTDSSTGFLQGSRKGTKSQIFSPISRYSIIHLPIKQPPHTAGCNGVYP